MDDADWIAEQRPGTEVDLSSLLPGQKAGWGDGETYHIVYTPVRRIVALSEPREWDGTIEDLTCPICGDVYGQPFEADDCCLSDDLETHDGMLDEVYGL